MPEKHLGQRLAPALGEEPCAADHWHGGRHARYPRAPGLAQSYIPRWAAAAKRGLFDFALGDALWTGKSRARAGSSGMGAWEQWRRKLVLRYH